jgi:hypothetical protein
MVYIHHTPVSNSYHYHNLQTCGSVWHCPICAAKISERRKVEVEKAIKAHELNGGGVYLLTFTLPHRLNQSLKIVLQTLLKASRAFDKDRAYVGGFRSTSGLVGKIRSLEVTYGANGWHPHLHLLLFANSMTNIERTIQEHELLTIWKRVVVNQGFDEPNQHGLTLENGDQAARYVSKWGLPQEMTKGHIKRSNKGFTPFDLLRVIVGQKPVTDSDMNSEKALMLFGEYGKTFKGKRQLVWSNGLKNHFNVGPEITDEEIAEQVDEKTVLFANIALPTWKIILKLEKRGEVLQVCEQGIDAFLDYLIDLTDQAGELEET